MSSSSRDTAFLFPKLTFGRVREFVYFTRKHEWHPGKLPLLLGFMLTLSLASPGTQVDLHRLASAYLIVCLFLAAAYSFNNLADEKQDSIAKKKIGLEEWSRRSKGISALAFAAVGLGLAWKLLPYPGLLVMICCYLLAWIYSFPPRLKEHPLMGPLVAAFAQIPAPAIALAVALGQMPIAAIVYLVIAFLYGLRMILVHQILDFENDRLTLTRTTATLFGRAAIHKVLGVIFKSEFSLTLVFIFVVVCVGLPKILLAALAWPLLIAITRLWDGKSFRLDSYDFIPLADVHESLLPLMLAAGLAMRDGSYTILVPLSMVVLFRGRHFDRLVRPLIGWERSDE